VGRQLDEAVGRLRADAARLAAEGGPDEHQVAANHLAWAVARAEAARACREWAERTADPLAERIAEVAGDEALAFAEGRSTELHALGAGRLVALRAAYRPLEDVGAGDEHRLLRATLREFAQREVRPRAQEVHRRDLDVPEEIIRGAAELGLFGLSVPETYGGVRSAEPDHRAMLVATEELSRASLAAGAP
jgi:(2S)-methylsuccinyl-CoA dehydrogenase